MTQHEMKETALFRKTVSAWVIIWNFKANETFIVRDTDENTNSQSRSSVRAILYRILCCVGR